MHPDRHRPPNTTYTFSGDVEGSYVYLGITGGSDSWTPSATSYQPLTTTYTTTSGQTTLQVYIHGWYAQPAYYADDLTLTTGAAGSSPTAAPTAHPHAHAHPDAHAHPVVEPAPGRRLGRQGRSLRRHVEQRGAHAQLGRQGRAEELHRRLRDLLRLQPDLG